MADRLQLFSLLFALFALFSFPMAPVEARSQTPPVAEVQARALAYADLVDDDLDAWSGRARWSNLLPVIRGDAGWLDQSDSQTRFREDLIRTGDGSLFLEASQNTSTDDERWRAAYGLQASVDLGGLIFDPAELHAAREARFLRAERRALLREVTEHYFRREQALRALQTTPPAERDALRLEAAAHAAQLDGLTGGWFGQQLAEGGER